MYQFIALGFLLRFAAFELRIEPVVEVGFKQLRKVFICLRLDSLHGKPQVRSPAIFYNPIADFIVGSAESEHTAVFSDILGKSTSGTPYSVVLTRKSCRIARLPDSESLIVLEENIDCSLVVPQWLRSFVRRTLKIEVDFIERQLRAFIAIRFQIFPSFEEIIQALPETLLHLVFPRLPLRTHCHGLKAGRSRSRSTSSIRSMLYRCSTRGDSLTCRIPASRPVSSLSTRRPYTRFLMMSTRGINR